MMIVPFSIQTQNSAKRVGLGRDEIVRKKTINCLELLFFLTRHRLKPSGTCGVVQLAMVREHEAKKGTAGIEGTHIFRAKHFSLPFRSLLGGTRALPKP